MRRIAIVVFFLVFGLVSCNRQQPAQPRLASGPHRLSANANAPDATHVDIIFHGLIGLVPLSHGSTTVFVSPDNPKNDPTMEHLPILSIETGRLGDANASVPDLVAPGYEGNGLAVWRFTHIFVDPKEVTDSTNIVDDKHLGAGETDFTKMRWLPHPDEIFGQTVTFNSSSLAEKVATGDWPAGQLTAIFDPDDLDKDPTVPATHEQEKWTICKRDQALADGFRLRLSLAVDKPVLNLKVTRVAGGPEEVIPVLGGTTVMLSNFPKAVLKKGQDMIHFEDLYVLIQPKDLPPCPPKKDDPMSPAARPARCAPMMFEE